MPRWRPMEPARFRSCLEHIGWSYRGLADRLGTSEARIRRWASGSAQIPRPVSNWLEFIANVLEAFPRPEWTAPKRERTPA